MNKPLTQLKTYMFPLYRNNIDTDILIPTSENTRMKASGFGDALFAEWRYTNILKRIPNPDFLLNQSPYNQSEMMLSGKNFGCGSSRESAVWALRDYGFRVICAISFNETFQKNCINNGVLPLTLPAMIIEKLCQYAVEFPNNHVHFNLEQQTITTNQTFQFDMDPYNKMLLIQGITELDLLKQYQSTINAHKKDNIPITQSS